MITKNFKFENGNLVISKDELIRLRNEYHNNAQVFGKERTLLLVMYFKS